MKKAAIVLYLSVLFVASCTQKMPNDNLAANSKVAFTVNIHNNGERLGNQPLPKTTAITKVVATVEADDMNTITQDMTKNGDNFTATLSVPKGADRTFTIEAMDANDIMQYDGTTTQSIDKDEENVSIDMYGIYPDPVTLTVAGTSLCAVNLEWDASQAEDFWAYRITRTTAKTDHHVNSDVLLDIESKSTTSYSDTDVSPGTTYYYTIWVIDTEGFAYGSITHTTSTASKLMSVTIASDYLRENQFGFFFVSDPNGKVLSVADIENGQSITLQPETDIEECPDNISVTKVITTYDDVFEPSLYFSTDLNVAVGSEWIFKTSPRRPEEKEGTLEITLKNIPEHEGYVLSSKWNSLFFSTSELSSPVSHNIYVSPTWVYIKLNTINNGPQYAYFNDKSPGSHTFNLESMFDMSSKSVSMPVDQTGGYFWLYGFEADNDRYSGQYGLDQVVVEMQQSEIIVNYPPTYDRDYRFSGRLSTEEYSHMFRYFGEIPDEVETPTGQYTVQNKTADDLRFTASGQFDRVRSIWYPVNGAPLDDINVEWSVNGPSDRNRYALPELPERFKEDYGVTMEHSDWELGYLDLIEYSDLESWQEFIDVLFKSNDYFYNLVDDEFITYKPSLDGLLKSRKNNSREDFNRR